MLAVLSGFPSAQEESEGDPASSSELTQTEATVAVESVPRDAEIAERLKRIYAATGWYEELRVDVDEGVVFLRGITSTPERSEWAADLAGRTEGVVGVANRMRVDDRITWSFDPAWQTLRKLTRGLIERVPLMAFGLVVLLLTAGSVWLANRIARRLFERRLSNRILIQVGSTLVTVPVLLIGLYVFLQVAGLTRLAATVLGGTGLFGLIVGIAFRDVAENFLASVLISIKRPFRIDDLIEVDGKKGYVQSVTTRGTMLMTLEGNHIHIPNAAIYKSTVYNFSANPRSRFDFPIGVDYEDSASRAQEVCLDVLRDHPAVLEEPEPLVLVEDLGASSVVLRVYFWVDVHKHSGNKVRSSVIRKVKVAIAEAGLTMPDDAREVIFPRAVPVQLERQSRMAGHAADSGLADDAVPRRSVQSRSEEEDDATSTAAEGGFESESVEIQKQAGSSEALDMGG